MFQTIRKFIAGGVAAVRGGHEPEVRVLREPDGAFTVGSSYTDHPHYTRRCWVIRDGKAEERDIHEATVVEGLFSARFAAGHIPPDREVWLRNEITALTARCCPWVNCHIGPNLYVTDLLSGTNGAFWGYYHPNVGEYGSIFVNTELRTDRVIETTHHEIWHIVRPCLRREALAAVDAHVQRGSRWANHAYLNEADERRARAYAHYAMLWDEGCSVPVDTSDIDIGRLGLGKMDHLRVFWSVYSGGAAREIQRRTAQEAA
ncbi:hypothetical protein [Azospirillum argentinense]|uniref:hypothetical protein n=1 Tax=Azospirillum argentinense TaxID=2970906 RepID=UPI0032DE8CB5